MPECCGQERTTKFCPDCGKPITHNNPLIDLLVHLRKNVKLFKKRGDQFEANLSAPIVAEHIRSWATKGMVKSRSMQKKWQDMADALSELMSSAEATGQPQDHSFGIVSLLLDEAKVPSHACGGDGDAEVGLNVADRIRWLIRESSR